MADRIKGLTIEIGGDTTGLKTALSSVEDSLKTTGNALKDINKLLKLDPTNVTLLEQKQKALATQTQDLKTKMDTLKTASEQAAKTKDNWNGYKEKYDTIQKEVEETSKQLEKLKGAQEKAAQAFKEGKISEEQYKKVESEVAECSKKLQDLQKAQKAAHDEFGNPISPKQYDALQREIIETEQALLKVAKQAAATNTAVVNIKAAGQAFQGVGREITAVGRGLSTYVTTPLVGMGATIVIVAGNFEQQMQKVKAITNSSGEDMDRLNTKARGMGATTKFSATEAGQAFEYMAMAGWKTRDMLDGIEGIMNLAAASGEELALTSDIVTDALTAFGLKASDSGHFADVLAAASSNANTNVAMLGESFKYAAPVVGAMKGSAEDAAIALGLMANAGIKGSEAGTALRTGLVNLVKPSKQMAEAMEKYSIEIKKNSDGSLNLRDTMIDLRAKLGNLTAEEQAAAAAAIFGKNSMAGWLAIVNATGQDFTKLTGAIDNCNGETQRMADTMNDSLKGQLTILRSAFEELCLQLAETLVPIIKDVVKKFQEWVAWFQSLSDSTKETIVKVGLVAAAIGPVLVVVGLMTTAIGKLISGIGSLVQGWIYLSTTWTQGIGVMGKIHTLLAGLGPIGLTVVASIGALAAAFIHLMDTNSVFKEKVSDAWNSAMAVVDTVGLRITTAINKLGFSFNDLGEVIYAAWDWFCNELRPILTGVITFITQAISGIADIFTGVIEFIVGLIDGFLHGNWTTFCQGLRDIWDGFCSLLMAPFKAVWEAIKDWLSMFNVDWEHAWDDLGTAWNQFWSDLGNGILGIIQWFVDGVVSAIKSMGDLVMAAWDGLSSGVKTIVNALVYVVSGEWLGLGASVAEANDDIQEDTTRTWEDMVRETEGSTTSWRTWTQEQFSTFGTWCSEHWKSLSSSTSELWGQMTQACEGLVQDFNTWVETKWGTFSSWCGTHWENLKTATSTTWTNMMSACETAVGDANSWIQGKWEAFSTWCGTHWENLKTATSTTWQGMMDTCQTTIQSFNQAVQNGWTTFSIWCGTHWEALKNATSTTWENMCTAIQGKTDAFNSYLEQKWEAVKTYIGEKTGNIREDVATAWDAVKTKTTEWGESVYNTIRDKWISMKETIETKVTEVKETVAAKWEAVKTNTATWCTDLGNKVSTGWQWLWEQVKGTVADLTVGVRGAWAEDLTDTQSWMTQMQTTTNSGWTQMEGRTDKAMGSIESCMDTGYGSTKTKTTSWITDVKNLLSQGWTEAGNTIQQKVDYIKERISSGWDNAKNSTSNWLSQMENSLSMSWQTMYSTISQKVHEAYQSIMQVWTSSKSATWEWLTEMRTGVVEKWNDIKTSMGNILDGIKDRMSSVWNTLESLTSGWGTRCSNLLSFAWNGIKVTINNALVAIINGMRDNFNSACTTVTGVFERIKNAISTAMNNAANTVSKVIQRIKGFFNFSWSLPKLKLPHVSFTGHFSLNPPSVPHFSIQWYRKAMENGMILNNPTIFGIKGSQLLGAGEAGEEVVAGAKSLMDMIRSAVSSSMSSASMNSAGRMITNNYGGITIEVYGAEGQSERELAEQIGVVFQQQIRREEAVWA